MSEKAVGIGMIGCGTVGGGAVKMLLEQADLYAQRLGKPLELVKVLVRPEDVGERTAMVPDGVLTTDAEAFFATEGMDIMVELAGGRGIISEFFQRALKAGKHVVTANKALLAAEGPELFKLARENNVSIGFEASCAGAIPCITAMNFGLLSNEIAGLYGILNGTCNYILTEMIQKGKDYATALREAQEKGYAEADPTLDVTGGDTAHKVAILASLAFGVSATDDLVKCEGIDQLDLEDITFGAELGYDIKLLGIAERSDGGISLQVGPCFVSKEESIAQVHGSFNALSIYGHAAGHTMYYGRGAGQMPTASAVINDVMAIADGWYASAFKSLNIWPDQHEQVKLVDGDELVSRFYLRINAMDKPGVIAKVGKVLGDAGISISAVMQHEANAGSFVPVVITTHQAKQGAVVKALAEIAAMDVIDGEPKRIRIIEMPEG